MIREASWLGTPSERVLWSVDAVQVGRFVSKAACGGVCLEIEQSVQLPKRIAIHACQDGAVIAERTGHRDLLARGLLTVLCRTRCLWASRNKKPPSKSYRSDRNPRTAPERQLADSTILL